MAEIGTRCTTERVQIGNSLPTAARVVFLPDSVHLRSLRAVLLPDRKAPGGAHSEPQLSVGMRPLVRGIPLLEARDSNPRTEEGRRGNIKENEHYRGITILDYIAFDIITIEKPLDCDLKVSGGTRSYGPSGYSRHIFTNKLCRL